MDQPQEYNEPTTLKPSLPIEETPIIEPIQDPVVAPTQPPVQPEQLRPEVSANPSKKRGNGCGTFLGNLIFFVLLFGLGIWLSTQLRSVLTPEVVPENSVMSQVSPTRMLLLPTSTRLNPSETVIQKDTWVSYPLSGGAGEKGMTDVAYQLPASVLAPVCDSASCVSRGTNLPGGTRFTVALRGTGYPLPDFRGAILTDTAGREFTMKQTTVGGKDVYEYTGNFTGRTGGGYTFTKMRGVLVPITAKTSVDFNHFAPTGITSDFAADDALFDEIVGRWVIPATK